MSRWLLNVAQVLEKLDDRAEQAVEEHQQLLEEQQEQRHMLMTTTAAGATTGRATSADHGMLDGDGNEGFAHESDPIASILAARGLAAGDDDDEEGSEGLDDGDAAKIAEEEEEEEWEGQHSSVDAHDGDGGGEGWGELSITEATASERLDDDDHCVPQASSGAADEAGAGGVSEDEEPDNERPSSEPVKQVDDIGMDPDSELVDPPPAEPLTDETAASSNQNQTSSATNRRSILPNPLVASFTSGTPSAAHAAAAAANLASSALKSWGGGNVAATSRQSPGTEPSPSGSSADNAAAASQQQLSQFQEMLRQAQKEVRTLRRNVVALNKQLEGAERELVAQRNELEQAAERMVKDSARHKEERERERGNHQSQIQALKSEQEAALQAQNAEYEALLDESRTHLKSIEDQRRQEGGNRDKELADALDREQQAVAKLESLEDERATLLSQISTLQSQQESLGSRIESLSQTAENAFAREREAEERLDEALSMHARQISQRQAREAELERTVSELGAALVAAEKQNASKSDSSTGEQQTEHGEMSSAALLRVAAVESELEALRSQLFDEQQRNHTLEAELREAARERNEEALVAQKRQEQHDRRVDELNQTVSQLKTELAAARDAPSSHHRHGSSAFERSMEVESLQSQIQNLSDEVVRHRDKLGSAQSEVSALRSRLSAALERAQSAETALEDAQAAAMATGGRGADPDDNDGDDVEPGLTRMRSRLHRVRQRGRGGVLGRNQQGNTMRSALKLDGLSYPHTGGGGGTAGVEAIGKTLDALDSLLSQTGRVLRANPIARLFLVAYLVLLHVWTFVAILFHAHGMDGIHGDFGGSDRHPMAAMMLPQSSPRNPMIPSPPVQIGGGAVANGVAGEQVVQVNGP